MTPQSPRLALPLCGVLGQSFERRAWRRAGAHRQADEPVGAAVLSPRSVQIADTALMPRRGRQSQTTQKTLRIGDTLTEGEAAGFQGCRNLRPKSAPVPA